MTIKKLEEYRHLKNEIKQICKRLERMLNNKDAFTFDTVKGSSYIKPYQERVITVTGGISHRYKNIETYNELNRILENRKRRIQDSIIEIEEFINTIERSEIRQIIEYRYVQGLSWLVTARRVYGYPCEDRARKAITRLFAEI